MIYKNERTANDSVNRLLKHHYLHQAHEAVDWAQGRGNRIVFLTRTGLSEVVQKGQVREEDIAYYWRGEDHWHPLYREHDVAVNDVLCAFIKQAREHSEHTIDLRLDPHTPLTGRDETMGVVSPLSDNSLLPDRVFAVKYDDQVAEVFLEVDLGTEGKTVWQEKIEKYLRSPEVMQQPGVLVLCVANTPQRMNTLLRWSRDLVDDRFLFSYFEAVCYGYERRGKKLVLAREGNPFGKIWHVVTTEDPRSLFGKLE